MIDKYMIYKLNQQIIYLYSIKTEIMKKKTLDTSQKCLSVNFPEMRLSFPPLFAQVWICDVTKDTNTFSRSITTPLLRR